MNVKLCFLACVLCVPSNVVVGVDMNLRGLGGAMDKRAADWWDKIVSSIDSDEDEEEYDEKHYERFPSAHHLNISWSRVFQTADLIQRTPSPSVAWPSNHHASMSLFGFNDTDDAYNDLLFQAVNQTPFENGTAYLEEDYVGFSPAMMIIVSVTLGIIILATVIGNVFVIAAILMERNLQSVANYLILSLAVADLMVACLVMPLGAVYEVNMSWILGPELCDMWTSSDVLCCTASILHLVAIALDRYWAVTQVDYIHQRNSQRIGLMIVVIWTVSFLVSIAPLFGLKDADFNDRVNLQKKCLISQDIAYQVFATMATFYVPLTVILILYWKIWQTARKRIRRHKPGSSTNVPKGKQLLAVKQVENANATTAFTKLSSSNTSPDKSSSTNGSANNAQALNSIATNTGNTIVLKEEDKATTAVVIETVSGKDVAKMEMVSLRKEKRVKESVESKREKKAAKTLAIITGAFVMCWLPFFVAALLMPLCTACWMDDTVFAIFQWLGFFNSTLNPIIYTIFSPEFRNAFKRILFGKSAYRGR